MMAQKKINLTNERPIAILEKPTQTTWKDLAIWMQKEIIDEQEQ
jgi:hypothetical protein